MLGVSDRFALESGMWDQDALRKYMGCEAREYILSRIFVDMEATRVIRRALGEAVIDEAIYGG